jgi:hypothetical protein
MPTLREIAFVVKPGDFGEVMQRAQNGVNHQKQFKGKKKGQPGRKNHKADIDTVNLVGIQRNSHWVRVTLSLEFIIFAEQPKTISGLSMVLSGLF